MTPIVTPDRFRRVLVPLDIIPLIDKSHRGAAMLMHMCRRHPKIFTRDELMRAGNFNSANCGGPVCAFTSFHWWVLRINDRLPRTGWRINDKHGYRLAPISNEQAAWLEQRLNGVAA